MVSVSADTANQSTAAGGGMLARDKRSYREQNRVRTTKPVLQDTHWNCLSYHDSFDSAGPGSFPR